MSVLFRNPQTATETSSTSGMAALREILRAPDLQRMLPGLVLSSFLINVLSLALPMAILQFMDRVVANQSLGTLTMLSIGVVIALLLEEALRLSSSHVTGWLGARYEHAFGLEATRHLMQVPLRVLERDEPIRHVERIGAAAQVADFYSGRTLVLLFDLPFVFLFLWVIYLIGGWVVVVPIVMLSVFSVASVRFGTWLRQLVERRHDTDDRRYNFLVEVFGGLHTLKTHALEAQMERRHETLQASNSDMMARLTYGNALASATGLLFSQAMIICVIFSGAWGVLEGSMTPGGLAACMMLSVRALQPLRRSLGVWLRFQLYQTARDRLHEIEKMPQLAGLGGDTLPPIRTEIELRDVSVAGAQGVPVLDHISLRIAAGECIAIRGDSGSGKSCLMSMLNGLDRPGSGDVLADGRSLALFDADSVQARIALLPQAGNIFAGTILQNITMFDDRQNEAAIEIARQLGLDQVVAGYKLGYETQLGESSSETLPQGVRQVITIARALLPNPDVVLLDEANIALDMQADQKLRELLEQRKGKTTLILVTHRPSYLSMAQRVFTLEKGRLLSASDEQRRSSSGPADGRSLLILPRPPHTEEIEQLVQRHFSDPSDFSNCLVPLLKAVKWQGRPQEFAESLPHLMRHMDLSGFCDTLANLGLLPHHFSTRLSRLDTRLMPCLAVSAERAALLVHERLADGRLRCHDGASNSEVLLEPTREEVEVYLFRREDVGADAVRKATSWFGRLFMRFRRHILLAFALTVVSTLLTLAPPLFVRSVFDHVLTTGDTDMQGYLLAGVAIALTLDFALRRLKGKLIAHIGGRTEYLMGVSIFRKVIGLPTSYTENASVSRQVGRIRSFESLRDFFVGPLTVIVLEMPANLIVVAVLAILNPMSLAVIAGALLAYILLAWMTAPFTQRAVARSGQAVADYRALLIEMMTNMRAIRCAGHRREWLARQREQSAKEALARYREHQVQSNIGSAAEFISNLTGLLVLAISAFQTIQGNLSGGGMMATMMLVWRLTGPLHNLFLAFSSLSRIRTNAQQIENLMKIPAERDGGVRQTLRPPSAGALSFARVSFRYANDADPALLGVSFNVKPGELVVVTGSSGAGKSTLFRLVERTHVPQAGVIRLDNIDIRQLPVLDMRGRISYMPQECELFYGTVSQNLRLAYPTATDAEVEWAIDMAGLRDSINSLPEKMQTRISDSSALQMPNGFKQQLVLARTILRPAPVVLLDEPATGLDDAGETALLRCMAWLREHSTVLAISHRPSHMRMADTVIYLERGVIAASGKYDDIKDRIMAGTRA